MVAPVAPGTGDALRAAIACAADAGPCSAAELAQELYGRWYCAPGSGDGRLPPGCPPDLGEHLRSAHAHGRTYERGWVAAACGPGPAVAAVRDGHQRRCLPPDYVNRVRPGVPPAPGEELALVARIDWEDDGWWLTESAELGAPGADAVRLYWNVGVGGVAAVVSALTADLTAAGVKWLLKCPLDPRGYARRDVVVVLLAAGDWPVLGARMRAVHARLERILRDGIPPLTAPLGRGLGLAEDPGAGQSFGQSRCDAIARALAEPAAPAAPGAPPALADPLRALAERLTAAGIDLERPHLRPGSRGEYAW